MESLELLLAVEGVCVYRVHDSHEPIELARGQLDLLVQPSTSQCLLRVGEVVLPLNKEVQVVKGKNSAYMVLVAGDMLCFTANPEIPEEVAEVLEMSLADSCLFIRESEERQGLEVVELVEMEPVDPLVQPQEATESRLKRLYKQGKEKLRAGLAKGATLAFVTYLKGKVYLKKRFGKKKSVSRPQANSISLDQAVGMLKEMKKEAPQGEQLNLVEDILQNYGRMSQHLSQHKPPPH